MDEKKHPKKLKKIKFKKGYNGKQNGNRYIWVLGIGVVSFIIAIVITLLSMNVIYGRGFIFSISVVLFIIVVAIISDIIGVAVTACNERPFYSLASRKVPGAKIAIKLCRNADRVSTLCNDVVGDICSIISGVTTSYIIIVIIGKKGALSLAELIITGVVAALTVGGKSFGKIIAIRFSSYIVYWVSILIEFILKNIYYIKASRNKLKLLKHILLKKNM